MLDLDYNACLTMLVLGFIFALICVRALMAVVNRAFLVVDYAKEQIYGKEGGQGGSFGMKDMVGGILKAVAPAIQEKAKEWLGVKPK